MEDVVISSLPWGVLNEGAAVGDKPFEQRELFTIAQFFSLYLTDNAVVVFHIPPDANDPHVRQLHDAMTAAKWASFKSLVIVPHKPRVLSLWTEYQMQRNSTAFVVYHRDGRHPNVSAAFVRELMPDLEAKAKSLGTYTPCPFSFCTCEL